jgi:hypothetical protein
VAPRGVFKDSGLQTINSRLYVLPERKQPHDRRLVANRGKHSICQFQLMLQALKLGYEVHLIAHAQKEDNQSKSELFIRASRRKGP